MRESRVTFPPQTPNNELGGLTMFESPDVRLATAFCP
jgi:hypothetical protein